MRQRFDPSLGVSARSITFDQELRALFFDFASGDGKVVNAPQDEETRPSSAKVSSGVQQLQGSKCKQGSMRKRLRKTHGHVGPTNRRIGDSGVESGNADELDSADHTNISSSK